MFLVIMFIVCFDYMLSIARIIIMFMHMFSKSSFLSTRVSGPHCVSMVLICCLPTDALYIPDHMGDHECDILIESFVVHSPNIGQVEPSCEGIQVLFLIFLCNVSYV
jgi:hypothetical protein